MFVKYFFLSILLHLILFSLCNYYCCEKKLHVLHVVGKDKAGGVNLLTLTLTKVKKAKVVKVTKVTKFAKVAELVVAAAKTETETKTQNVGTATVAKSIKEIVPTYPYRSRLLKEEGVVSLKITVETTGEVSQVEIVKSSNFERLDLAAMSALKDAQFVSAYEGGVAVKSDKIITFHFKLQ